MPPEWAGKRPTLMIVLFFLQHWKVMLNISFPDINGTCSLVTFNGIPIGTPKDFFEWAKKSRSLKYFFR